MEKEEMNLNAFLETLNRLIRYDFSLKEEVYIEAVKEARRISIET